MNDNFKTSLNILKTSRYLISVLSAITEFIALELILSDFFGLSGIISVIFSGSFAILIELASLFFSVNSIKIRAIDNTLFFMYLAIAILFYSLSFTLSAYGTYNYVEQTTFKKLDKSKNVYLEFSDKINFLEKQIKIDSSEIETIKKNKQGWSGGRRTSLIQSQLDSIATHNYRIKLSNKELLHINSIIASKSKVIYLDAKKIAKNKANFALTLIVFVILVQIVITFILSKLNALNKDTDSKINEMAVHAKSMINSFVQNEIMHATLNVQKKMHENTKVIDNKAFERSKMNDFNVQKEPVHVQDINEKMNVQNVFKVDKMNELNEKIKEKQNRYLKKYPAVVKDIRSRRYSLKKISERNKVSKSTVFNIKNVFE